jgi:hypothetical protein
LITFKTQSVFERHGPLPNLSSLHLQPP